MLPTNELIATVDAALDEARHILRVANDEALAANIGVSPKTISFWRNGRWTPADTALIRVLVSTLPALQPPNTCTGNEFHGI